MWVEARTHPSPPPRAKRARPVAPASGVWDRITQTNGLPLLVLLLMHVLFFVVLRCAGRGWD